MPGQFAVVSSVAYQDVVAAASYSQVQALAQYVSIAVSAEATFPDRLVVDVVTPDDFLEKEVGKVFGDGVPVSDVLAFASTKGLSDTTEATDAILFDIAAAYADTALLDESLALLADKPIQNFVTPYDTLSFEPGITLMNNQVFMVDGVTLDVGLNLSDSVSVTESLMATRQYDRDFFDSLDATDSLEMTAEKIVSDGIAAADQVALAIGKTEQDSVTALEIFIAESGKSATDAASVNDVLTLTNAFVRDFADAATVTDTLVRSISISGLADTITPGDSLDLELLRGGALNTVALNVIPLN